MFSRSAFPNYDRDQASVDTGLSCPEEGNMAKQEFKEEVDINTLLRRFNITGQLPVGVRMPVYSDFEEVFDFHTAANAIALARESFDELPAEVRRRFENDPGQFVDFVLDEGNRAEAERLGLVHPADLPAEPPVGAQGASAAPSGGSVSLGDTGAVVAALGTSST